MSAGLDPRIVWQRALFTDAELARTPRMVGLLIGSQLTYACTISIGLDQLAELSGFSSDVAGRATRALRGAGWLFVQRRGYRGRTSEYMAEIPGLVRRVEVGVTGREYVAWAPPTSAEYMASTPPIPTEKGASTPPTSAEYTASTPPIGKIEGAHAPPLSYVQELRTYVGDEPSRQSPALAAVPAAGLVEVIDALPHRLKPATAAAMRRMEQLVGQRLASGWAPEQLIEATAQVGDVAVRDAPAFWANLVPVTAPPRAPERWRPTWCGACDERTRMVELADGTPMRCGNCNPQVLGVPEPR